MPDPEITDAEVVAYDEAWQRSMRNDGIYDLANRAGLAAFCEARDRHVAARTIRELIAAADAGYNLYDTARRMLGDLEAGR